MQNLRPAAFLDRDGTINVDKGYLYKAEDFEYLDGAVEGLKLLQDKKYLLVVITNQSGIAREYYREEDFKHLNKWMIEDLQSKGISISAVYYCPHHPSANCTCRKPRSGLFWKAQRELGIDMDRSIAVGDRERDLCICSESNVKGYLTGQKSLFEIAKEIPELCNVEQKK